MIVRRITLHKFAGGSGRSAEFLPGLNVVLGPNEAGKTTLSSALRCVLFAGGPMTQVRFRAEIQPFLPIGIGDTARVALEFAAAGSTYILERSWTAPKLVASRLQIPGGGELSDEGEIQRSVSGSLGVTPGTYEHVLCVSQARLTETINRLAEDANGVSGGFADVLRKSLYESDGIAIDQLVSQLETQINGHYGRWDRSADAPEKGRGLEAPWEKGAGIIVKAYYDYLRAKQAFEEADAYEKTIDKFVGQEMSFAARKQELSSKVAEYAPLAADARIRADLTTKLNESGREAEELRAVLDQWPKVEAQLVMVSDSIQTLLSRHAALEMELDAAQERTNQQAHREKYAKAHTLHQRVVEEEERLSKLPRISEHQLENLKRAHAALQNLEIQISAQKLAVKIVAKSSMDVTVKEGPLEKTLHIEPGEEYSAKVPGKVSIAHRDWQIDVSSADENVQTLERQQVEALSKLNTLLHEVGVGTIEEATVVARALNEQTIRVEKSRAALAAILENESFESLANRVRALPLIKPGRSEKEITDDRLEVKGQGVALRAEENALQKECNKWVNKYGSRDQALLKFTSRKGEEQRIREQLTQCKPLPAQFQDAEEFLRSYESMQVDLKKTDERLHEVKEERLEFEKNMPEQSRDELKETLDQRRSDFERAKRHGEAYLRIRGELTRLLEVMDSDLFEPYHRRVRELLSTMTLRRHDTIDMHGNLPERLGVQGRQVMISQLSVGTLDVLAVAVRLAMAEAHLLPGDGFILLDDPLVNLDPDRQKAAAACLREFARNHQVILLTCHPSHAGLLGGATLELPLNPTADSRE